MTDKDIIYVDVLDCYIESGYKTKLCYIRFIKSKEKLTEKKSQCISFELEEYFEGKRKDFSCDIDISCIPAFAQKVLNETRRIKYGTTVTYSELAKRIGIRSARVVGRALSINPIPIVIPCHRVVAKNGIGGYSAGVDIKKRLLELEKTWFNNL